LFCEDGSAGEGVGDFGHSEEIVEEKSEEQSTGFDELTCRIVGGVIE
jgi:hypothetical protein